MQPDTEERRALGRGLEHFANESACGLRRPEMQTEMGAATDLVRCHAADWPGEFGAVVANLGPRVLLSYTGVSGHRHALCRIRPEDGAATRIIVDNRVASRVAKSREWVCGLKPLACRGSASIETCRTIAFRPISSHSNGHAAGYGTLPLGKAKARSCALRPGA